MLSFSDTPVWNTPRAIVSWDCYLGELRRGSHDVPSYAAPARATDLGNLPPTYLSVAEYDPLRDEGIAFASALLTAGVRVELHVFPGTFHGSSAFSAPVSRREKSERLAILRDALGL
jgi:acetyl esterase/lipase